MIVYRIDSLTGKEREEQEGQQDEMVRMRRVEILRDYTQEEIERYGTSPVVQERWSASRRQLKRGGSRCPKRVSQTNIRREGQGQKGQPAAAPEGEEGTGDDKEMREEGGRSVNETRKVKLWDVH